MGDPTTIGVSERCPEESLWLDLAVGLTPPNESSRLLEHAARCQDCARVLKYNLALFAEEGSLKEEALVLSLQNDDDRSHRIAAAAARNIKSAPPGTGRKPSWWLAIAAGISIILAGGGIRLAMRSDADVPPFGLLASAYTNRRTIDLRIPGASYGPMRLERDGSVSILDRSPELARSEAAIQRHLAAKPNDLDWVGARGVASLLEWHYDDAIKDLNLSLPMNTTPRPQTRAELLTNLAVAFSERAQATGNNDDLLKASDLLAEAIKLEPKMTAAIFNSAIVNEKLKRYSAAASNWNRYLTLDASSGWAEEARQHLNNLPTK